MLDNKLRQDLIGAMKASEALTVSVLRMLLSEMNYKKIDLGRDLTDEDIISVIQKEVKKRREAIESYTAGGRTESADSEKAELEILSRYLPVQMGEAEIKAEILKIPEISGVSEFGQVMKVVAPKFRGRADGGMVAKVVKEILS